MDDQYLAEIHQLHQKAKHDLQQKLKILVFVLIISLAGLVYFINQSQTLDKENSAYIFQIRACQEKINIITTSYQDLNAQGISSSKLQKLCSEPQIRKAAQGQFQKQQSAKKQQALRKAALMEQMKKRIQKLESESSICKKQKESIQTLLNDEKSKLANLGFHFFLLSVALLLVLCCAISLYTENSQLRKRIKKKEWCAIF